MECYERTYAQNFWEERNVGGSTTNNFVEDVETAEGDELLGSAGMNIVWGELSTQFFHLVQSMKQVYAWSASCFNL